MTKSVAVLEIERCTRVRDNLPNSLCVQTLSTHTAPNAEPQLLVCCLLSQAVVTQTAAVPAMATPSEVVVTPDIARFAGCWP